MVRIDAVVEQRPPENVMSSNGRCGTWLDPRRRAGDNPLSGAMLVLVGLVDEKGGKDTIGPILEPLPTVPARRRHIGAIRLSRDHVFLCGLQLLGVDELHTRGSRPRGPRSGQHLSQNP